METVDSKDLGDDIDPETGNFVQDEAQTDPVESHLNSLRQENLQLLQRGADDPHSDENKRYLEVNAELDQFSEWESKNLKLTKEIDRTFEDAIAKSSTLVDSLVFVEHKAESAQRTREAVNSIKQAMRSMPFASDEQTMRFMIEVNDLVLSQQLPKKVREVIQGILIGNLDEITDRLTRIEDYPLTLLELLRRVYDRIDSEDNASTTDRGQAKIAEAFGTIFRSAYTDKPSDFQHPIYNDEMLEQLCFYIDHVGGSLSEDYEEAVREGLTSERPADQDSILLRYNTRLLSSLVDTGNKPINDAVRDYMKTLDLDWDKLFETWQTLSQDKRRAEHMNSNFSNIGLLEHFSKGAAARLNRKYGIESFGRYPMDVLVAQDQESDKQRPYGVILYPKTDWNGAFHGQFALFSRLNSDLRELGYSLRVVEASGKYSAAKRLLTLNRDYGEQNKISFLVLGGHGSKNTVTLGAERNMDEFIDAAISGDENKQAVENLKLNDPLLTQDDMQKEWVNEMKAFFVDGFTIIFVSCSTGIEGGIAEEASKRGEAETIAPTKPAAPISIKVDKADDRLTFKVEFSEGESSRFGQPIRQNQP